MSKYAMEQLKGKLCRELDVIAESRDLSIADLERANKLTDTIKNIYKIEMMDSGGYSNDSYDSYRGRGNSYGNGYGNSYGNDSYRSRHWVRGHYSRDGYSRSEGIDYLKDQMRELMQRDDVSGEDRMCIEKAMNMLK